MRCVKGALPSPIAIWPIRQNRSYEIRFQFFPRKKTLKIRVAQYAVNNALVADEAAVAAFSERTVFYVQAVLAAVGTFVFSHPDFRLRLSSFPQWHPHLSLAALFHNYNAFGAKTQPDF
jgi:hypothetical protein